MLCGQLTVQAAEKDLAYLCSKCKHDHSGCGASSQLHSQRLIPSRILPTDDIAFFIVKDLKSSMETSK